MKICLASTCTRECLLDEIFNSKYILESFWYFKDWQKPLLKTADLFLVDSGAFTFMNQVNGNVNWDEYLNRYIKFVNDNDIEHFFELDIDSIVGYEAVKRIRAKLEQQTGKKSIPVWHVSRGRDEFIRMCEDYDYVSFGGLLTDGVPTKEIVKYMPWFIRTAHSYGCKIHGLGFTSLNELPNIHFDSVDSTSWLSGGRFGSVYEFTGNTLVQHKAPSGYKTVNYKELDRSNLREWIKYQNYANTAF